MAETQSTNLKLDLVDGDSLFDTDKVKSNFEKIDEAVGSLTDKMGHTQSVTFPFTPDHNGTLCITLLQKGTSPVTRGIIIKEDGNDMMNVVHYFSGEWGGHTFSFPLIKGKTYAISGDATYIMDERTRFIY